MRRPGIGGVPPGTEPAMAQFLQQLKGGVETLAGQVGTPITPLSTTKTPTVEELRDKVNQIIDWLSPR